MCCCIYHVEMDLMRVGLNTLREEKRGLHAQRGCSCACAVCSTVLDDAAADGVCCDAHHSVYKRITQLWEACLCPKLEFAEWHNLSCLMGECEDCGVETLPLCPHELSSEEEPKLRWKQFSYVQIGMDRETGKPKKRLQEVYQETSPVLFINYMKPKIAAFIKHNFIANWQDHQCKEMMRNLPEGVLVSHIDFAENYEFQIQNEVQSMYYMSEYVSLLVHITLQRVRDEDGELVTLKHTHYYISDDKKHDSLFVQHCLMLHWRWLNDNGQPPSEHWVFSDGCAGQFKGATAMYFVARYPSLTGGCSMIWNYFATGHGKGTHCTFCSMVNVLFVLCRCPLAMREI